MLGFKNSLSQLLVRSEFVILVVGSSLFRCFLQFKFQSIMSFLPSGSLIVYVHSRDLKKKS